MNGFEIIYQVASVIKASSQIRQQGLFVAGNAEQLNLLFEVLQQRLLVCHALMSLYPVLIILAYRTAVRPIVLSRFDAFIGLAEIGLDFRVGLEFQEGVFFGCFC